MPKIIKNGIDYCNTPAALGKASEILYDNTNTDLTSFTVQSVIGELYEKCDGVSDINEKVNNLNSNLSNSWINNSDVYEEIEKKVAEYGATSTFMLSFGTNNTNTPEGWNWWCLIYKCAKIIAWEHTEVCTNARNGANNYVGWERPLVANDGLKFKFGKDGDGNYGYYGADGSLVPFKIGNEMSIGLTATAADITEGKTALCNGVIVTGTRPAPSKMQSGTFSMSSASIEHLYKTIYFSPEFDTIPKIDYTLTGGRMSMSNVTVTKTYVKFDIYHNHGNDHHTATVVWTATAS